MFTGLKAYPGCIVQGAGKEIQLILAIQKWSTYAVLLKGFSTV